MIGWIIAGLLTVATVSAIVVTISRLITRSEVERVAITHSIERLVVKQINECTNVVRIQDLDNTEIEIEIHGEGVSDNNYEGQKIYT